MDIYREITDRMPEQLRRRQVVSSARDAVKLLVSLGVLQEDSVSLAALAG